MSKAKNNAKGKSKGGPVELPNGGSGVTGPILSCLSSGKGPAELQKHIDAFPAESRRRGLKEWQGFHKTSKSIMELMQLKQEIKRATRDRNIPILQYCVDQAVDSKIDGAPGSVKTKAVYSDAIKSMEVIQQDADIMDAYRAMNEDLLHKFMEDAKATDNKLAGYKLAVLIARCQYDKLKHRRAQREENARKLAMRTFQATLKQEDLEELQRREQEGRQAFLKWKKQKDAEERRKRQQACKAAEEAHRRQVEHEQELEKQNEVAFERWAIRKEIQKITEAQELFEQREFCRMVDDLRKARDEARIQINSVRRERWIADFQYDRTPPVARSAHADTMPPRGMTSGSAPDHMQHSFHLLPYETSTRPFTVPPIHTDNETRIGIQSPLNASPYARGRPFPESPAFSTQLSPRLRSPYDYPVINAVRNEYMGAGPLQWTPM